MSRRDRTGRCTCRRCAQRPGARTSGTDRAGTDRDGQDQAGEQGHTLTPSWAEVERLVEALDADGPELAAVLARADEHDGTAVGELLAAAETVDLAALLARADEETDAVLTGTGGPCRRRTRSVQPGAVRW